MQSNILIRFLLAASLALPLSATALSLNPIPTDGVVSGLPGTTVGWGFELSPDTQYWASITGSLLLNESNPLVGFYTDYIGFQGGPLSGVIDPNGSLWTQQFDSILQTGLGSYSIDPLTPAGSSNTATLRVLYETYTDNPFTCGSCFVASSSYDTVVTINVTDPATVPEPATLTLVPAAALLLWRRRRTG